MKTKYLNDATPKVSDTDTFHPIQLKQKGDEIRAYHRKRLYELSLKSIKQKPQLEKPNEEQKQWIKRKMHNSASWEVKK